MKYMKQLIDWYQGNNEVEKETPQSGIKRIFYLVVNYPEKLLAVNILFLLGCLPVVTIPASLAALNRYVMKLYRDIYGVTIADFLQEWKDSAGKALPTGIIVGSGLFYGYYLLSLAGNYQEGIQHDATTGIGIAVVAILLCFATYLYLLMAMFDLPTRVLMKNASIFLLLEWKTDIKILFIEGVFVSFVLLFMPYSVLFVLLIGFSFQQLFLCAILNPVLEQRMIKPYEEQLLNTIER